MSPVPPHLLPLEAKGLVFDCDGTLIDTMPNHFRAWKAAAEKYGLTLSLSQFIGYAGKPAEEIFDILCAEQQRVIDKLEFIAYKQGIYKQLMDTTEMQAITPVIAIVKAGKARELPMAVASGGTRSHVLHNLQSAGLMEYFSAIVTSEDVEHGKPAPDIFLLAAKKLGVPAADCVGYEDAVLGMQAIHNAGFLAAVDVTKLEGYPPFVD